MPNTLTDKNMITDVVLKWRDSGEPIDELVRALAIREEVIIQSARKEAIEEYLKNKVRSYDSKAKRSNSIGNEVDAIFYEGVQQEVGRWIDELQGVDSSVKEGENET